MLGHKAGTVNEIVDSINRRKEIEEVLEQLERSKSPRDLPDAVVKHARRLTLRDGMDDIVQVAWAYVPGSNAVVGCGPVDACVDLRHRFMPGLRWQVRAAPKKSIAASATPTEAQPLAVVP
jgi:hypothetical protein